MSVFLNLEMLFDIFISMFSFRFFFTFQFVFLSLCLSIFPILSFRDCFCLSVFVFVFLYLFLSFCVCFCQVFLFPRITSSKKLVKLKIISCYHFFMEKKTSILVIVMERNVTPFNKLLSMSL